MWKQQVYLFGGCLYGHLLGLLSVILDCKFGQLKAAGAVKWRFQVRPCGDCKFSNLKAAGSVF